MYLKFNERKDRESYDLKKKNDRRCSRTFITYLNEKLAMSLQKQKMTKKKTKHSIKEVLFSEYALNIIGVDPRDFENIAPFCTPTFE